MEWPATWQDWFAYGVLVLYFGICFLAVWDVLHDR